MSCGRITQRPRAIENLQQVREHPATRGRCHREEREYGPRAQHVSIPGADQRWRLPDPSGSVASHAARRPERFVLDRFGLTGRALEQRARHGARAPRGLGRLLLRARRPCRPRRSRTASSRRRRATCARVSACACSRARAAATRTPTRSRSSVSSSRHAPRACIADHGSERRPRSPARAAPSARTISTRSTARCSTRRWPIRSRCSSGSTRSPAPQDPAITQVMAGLGLEHRVVLVAGPEGLLVGDVRPLLRVSVACIAERGGAPHAGLGGRRRALRVLASCSTDAPSASRARRRARRWSTSTRARAGRHHDGGAGTRDGRASCCTRPSGTGSRATSTASARRRSPTASARASRPSSAPWSTTARSRAGAARSTSTTRARRPGARC